MVPAVSFQGCIQPYIFPTREWNPLPHMFKHPLRLRERHVKSRNSWGMHQVRNSNVHLLLDGFLHICRSDERFLFLCRYVYYFQPTSRKKPSKKIILANQKIAQGTLRFLHSIFALSVISPHAQSQNLLWLLVPVTKPCTGCWLLFNPSANARLVGSLDGLLGI